MARLAIDGSEQGRRLGAAEEFGVRALLVHAQDEDGAAFYRRYDFEPSPTDELHLFLLMKDLRRIVGQ